MRNVIVLLVTLATLLNGAASPASASNHFHDYNSWVQYVHDSCHPDAKEVIDEASGDHLPGRQPIYKDDAFHKYVKAYKNATSHKKSHSEAPYKSYAPGRQLIDGRPKLAAATATDPNGKSKPKETETHQKSKTEEKKVKGTKVAKPPTHSTVGRKVAKPPKHSPSSPSPRHAPSPRPAPSPFSAAAPFSGPTPLDTPIPSVPITGPSVIVVAKDGSGDFSTVQAAINSVPANNAKRAIIYVKQGVYTEKVLVPSNKPLITLKGESAALTFIQWGDTASTIGPNGKPLSTYGSASVAIEADSFIALDISFKNTAPAPQSGAVGEQAVALRVESDQVAFYACSIYGAQDTLYDLAGRHYYYKCYIEGSIDFIFGDARSLFVKCHLNSIATTFGSIAAQKRLNSSDNTGYSFAYCMVTGTGTIYLGRAWGAYSRIVYLFTYFDSIIIPQGWNDWNTPANDKTVFYGEYKCYGPGANTSQRVSYSTELTQQQAQPFLSLSFINGNQWLAS